jgi:hypothetical protein
MTNEQPDWKEATIWTLKAGALLIWITFIAICIVASITLGVRLAEWILL